MKTLSIRQPWAWLIIHSGKDIENRSWGARHTGRFLVHASKGMTRGEYEEVKAFACGLGVEIPPMESLERGGIIGSVEMFGCVQESSSPWFFGPYGFLLRNPKPLDFIPLKGRLGFFDALSQNDGVSV